MTTAERRWLAHTPGRKGPGAEGEPQAAIHPGQVCLPPWAWWALIRGSLGTTCSPAGVQAHMLGGWAALGVASGGGCSVVVDGSWDARPPVPGSPGLLAPLV